MANKNSIPNNASTFDPEGSGASRLITVWEPGSTRWSLKKVKAAAIVVEVVKEGKLIKRSSANRSNPHCSHTGPGGFQSLPVIYVVTRITEFVLHRYII